MIQPQAIQIRTARVSVHGPEQTYRHGSAAVEASGRGVAWRWDSVEVTCAIEQDGAVRVTIRNEGERDVRLTRVSLEWPAAAFSPALDARDYVQLYHSRDFMKLSGVRPVHRPEGWANPADASGMVTVLSHRWERDALLIGALPPYGDCFVDLPLLHEKPHRDGAFGIGVHLQVSRRLKAGQEVELARLVLLHGADGVGLLGRYGGMIRDRLAVAAADAATIDQAGTAADSAATVRAGTVADVDATDQAGMAADSATTVRADATADADATALAGAASPRPFKPRIAGWNSWDYYAGAVAEGDVVGHAAFARERYGDRLAYIVTDEGYECQWGVWDAGWKFQSGLDSLCREIRGRGYEAGIWTAPLMVNVYTPLYREHPDWFVGDGSGNVYLVNMGYGSMAQLDITRPEVAAHIGREFTRLREAGFTYFKCDFTQMLQGASSFARDDMTHAGMIRELFRTIRSAIGDEVYLLACGAPYEAVIGIADAHRTTGDIHHYWSQIRQNVRSMFARWWMQGNIGNTDPDFAIVRCRETTDDPHVSRRLPANPWSAGANWNSGREMNAEEAKTLLLACVVTGGDLVLGDALPNLNELGQHLLERVLDTHVEGGVPLNLFAREGDDLPVVLARDARDRRRCLLAVFNLSDDPRRVELPHLAAATDWREFWTGEAADSPLAETGGVALQPRSVRTWWFRTQPD